MRQFLNSDSETISTIQKIFEALGTSSVGSSITAWPDVNAAGNMTNLEFKITLNKDFFDSRTLSQRFNIVWINCVENKLEIFVETK